MVRLIGLLFKARHEYLCLLEAGRVNRARGPAGRYEPASPQSLI